MCVFFSFSLHNHWRESIQSSWNVNFISPHEIRRYKWPKKEEEKNRKKKRRAKTILYSFYTTQTFSLYFVCILYFLPTFCFTSKNTHTLWIFYDVLIITTIYMLHIIIITLCIPNFYFQYQGRTIFISLYDIFPDIWHVEKRMLCELLLSINFGWLKCKICICTVAVLRFNILFDSIITWLWSDNEKCTQNINHEWNVNEMEKSRENIIWKWRHRLLAHVWLMWNKFTHHISHIKTKTK